MTDRVIAIGDIHGCAWALETLLNALDVQPTDTIIPLGDIVDRGPETRRVIEQLLEIGRLCRLVPIRGNHEDMMLTVLAGAAPQEWIRHGGASTLESYGFVGSLDVVPAEHVAFLQSFQEVFETETHFFVHGNYDPYRSLSDQSGRRLRWTSLFDQLPEAHVSGKIAVVGHTALKDGRILNLPHLKCLDTYCYGGGWLTALDVSTGDVWQANERQEHRVGSLDEMTSVPAGTRPPIPRSLGIGR